MRTHLLRASCTWLHRSALAWLIGAGYVQTVCTECNGTGFVLHAVKGSVYGMRVHCPKCGGRS